MQDNNERVLEAYRAFVATVDGGDFDDAFKTTPSTDAEKRIRDHYLSLPEEEREIIHDAAGLASLL